MSAIQLSPGSVVAGKYKVVALLGYGGSSATYHAVAADGREVALKLFEPAIRQRADIMAAIEQTYAGTNALPPDVAVPLLDAGYDPNTGAPFSVTERIPFPSLAQLVAQRPLSPEEASALLNYLARAVDAAHQRGLVHHALKPTNIFVGFQHGQGVRVTDFGAGLARSAVPTNEGYALAAPWMAPEQVQGSSPAGPQADVFAAALVTFFALTGRSYWRSCQGQLDLAGWQRELFAPRTPPSARAIQLGGTLNSAFDNVLGAALSVEPAQRYRSIGELAAALESLVASTKGGPESAATMAFPAMGLGEYPPPPAPTGGMGAPPPAAGQPANAGMSAQQPENAGAGGPSGYVPAQAPAASPAEASMAPMAAPEARKPAANNKMVPILVGVVALLLVGGAAAAWAVMRSPSTPEATDTAASATPTATAAEVATGEPPAPASAEPAASAVPAATEQPTEAPPTTQEVVLSCDPACDELNVDGNAVTAGAPVALAAGKHAVTGSKSGFQPLKADITVTLGKKLEKTFKLSPTPTAAGPVKTPPTVINVQPKCGKFLKKCK